MENLNNLNFDAAHIWHPYTSVAHPPLLHEVISAQGVKLKLADDREVIDGMSSWWAAIHGYNHPILNQAVTEQLSKMSHVMFGGLTHEPAVSLAKRLIDITDDSLQYVFFSDSGSVSVEVAIKMAIQHWFAQGYKKKQRLLTVKNGYHGDTFATMSVCDPDNGMHSRFAKAVTKQFHAPAPSPQTDAEWDDSHIVEFKQLISVNHQELAAVILEPLVQGAGGMRMYCPEYLRQVKSLCKAFDVLLIFDEIATGFGRTGSLFAYEQANVVPDILCLGKALTGGYMSLAATLCNERVASGIAKDGRGVLMHGPTFMANPLACAVAGASIDLLLSSNWVNQVHLIEQQLIKELSPLSAHHLVKAVRVKGAIGVVELKQTIDEQMNWIPKFFVDNGVWIRPFSNLVYIMPPYIIESDELSLLTQSIKNVVDKLAEKIC